jgi:hypothetical protein
MAKLSPPVLPALDARNPSNKNIAANMTCRRTGRVHGVLVWEKAGVYLRGYGRLSSQGRSGKADCRYVPMALYLVRVTGKPLPSSASSTLWTVAWNHQSRRERGHHKRIILTVQPAELLT